MEANGLRFERIVQTVTLSKAFGTYGGAVLAAKAIAQQIIERSRIFAGNTPVPLPLANGALAALRLIRQRPQFRERLRRNVVWLKTALRSAGLPLPDHPGPIISFVPKTPAEARRCQERLFAADIYPPFILYPGGPPEGFFRFAISSSHTRPQLQALVEALKE